MSNVHETGKTPRFETRPVLGRMPVTPQTAAGMRIEPAVSVPSVPAARSAPIAPPLPPLEPPQMRSGSHGLRAAPRHGLVVIAPKANSCVLSLPSTIAPARRSRSTTAESSAGTLRRSSTFEAQVVGTPRDVDHVLDPDRDAPERPSLASGTRSRSAASASAGSAEHGDVVVERRGRAARSARGTPRDRLGRRHLAGAQAVGAAPRERSPRPPRLGQEERRDGRVVGQFGLDPAERGQDRVEEGHDPGEVVVAPPRPPLRGSARAGAGRTEL